MVVSPNEEWDDPPYTGIIFFQTSIQNFLQTETINGNMKKVNVSIMHVGDTILDAAAEAGIDENW